jgi:hypothetical protein
MAYPFELVFIESTHTTPCAHGPLQLSRRAAPGELEQRFLTFGCSHTRERPYFGERKLSLLHRGADLRQPRQDPGGTHLLAGCTQVDPDPEGEPMGTRAVASGLPSLEPVELGDEGE